MVGIVAGIILLCVIAGLCWQKRRVNRALGGSFESINRSLEEENRKNIVAHRKKEFEEEKTLVQKVANEKGVTLSDEQAETFVEAAYESMISHSLVNDEMTRAFGPNWLERGEAKQQSDFEPVHETSTAYHSYWHITDIRKESESYGLPLIVRFQASDGNLEDVTMLSAVVRPID